MKKQFQLFFPAFVFALFGFVSCTKINESTTLGGNLIPTVDNVTTFDTTIEVATFNHTFTAISDSTRSSSSDIQMLGFISNDALFGQSSATMFFELNPPSYPFKFPYLRSKDSVINNQFDSVVLVLGYAGTWGDSTKQQTVNVYEVNSNFSSDSTYLLGKQQVFFNNTVLGSRTFVPQNLKDSVKILNERAKNQLRIPLASSIASRLFSLRDSIDYLNDSTFNEKFLKGFAIVPQANGQANAFVGFNLRDTNTKLAVYFRERVGGRDSSRVVYLRFNYQYLPVAKANSASANFISRNYSGALVQNYLGGSQPDDQVFLQSAPGTFARIRIPALKSLSNRIIHRAELVMQQIPDAQSNEFTAPQFLYLDAFDSAKTGASPDTAHRAIPFDVNLVPVQAFPYGTYPIFQIGNPVEFGMAGKLVGTAREWRFNLSRYVQRIVNRTEPFYELRLTAPVLVENYIGGFSSNIYGVTFVNQLNGVGRVRLGGGTNNPGLPNRMRLRIIYSKL